MLPVTWGEESSFYFVHGCQLKIILPANCPLLMVNEQTDKWSDEYELLLPQDMGTLHIIGSHEKRRGDTAFVQHEVEFHLAASISMINS